MIVVKGAELFRAFRGERAISYSETARALHVSRAAVYAWESGAKIPEADARERIAVWTGGAVPPDAWRTADAERLLAEVSPYEATPLTEE